MTDRKRDPLPAGYQFGDARPAHEHTWDRYDHFRCESCCSCGARFDPRRLEWFASDAERPPVTLGFDMALGVRIEEP